MCDPEAGPVCVEIAIAPDEHGVPFSPSGVLFLKATVSAYFSNHVSMDSVTCILRIVCLLRAGKTTFTRGQRLPAMLLPPSHASPAVFMRFSSRKLFKATAIGSDLVLRCCYGDIFLSQNIHSVACAAVNVGVEFWYLGFARSLHHSSSLTLR
jgi:hypothetical protein